MSLHIDGSVGLRRATAHFSHFAYESFHGLIGTIGTIGTLWLDESSVQIRVQYCAIRFSVASSVLGVRCVCGSYCDNCDGVSCSRAHTSECR
jgi:hypothetical protein